jgi:hypothetical protein
MRLVEADTPRSDGLICHVCNKRAGFMTPLGLMCGEHALMASVYGPEEEPGWMPIRIHRPGAAVKRMGPGKSRSGGARRGQAADDL